MGCCVALVQQAAAGGRGVSCKSLELCWAGGGAAGSPVSGGGGDGRRGAARSEPPGLPTGGPSHGAPWTALRAAGPPPAPAPQPPARRAPGVAPRGVLTDTPRIFKGEDDRDLDVPVAPEFDTIADALAAVRAGEFVVVLDDESRENEGDLIAAADRITPQASPARPAWCACSGTRGSGSRGSLAAARVVSGLGAAS